MKFEKRHTLWLDGLLDEKSARKLEAEGPGPESARAAEAEKALHRSIREALVAGAAATECPHGDFVNSRVLDAIRAGQPADHGRARQASFRLAWAGAACFAVAFVLALLWWPSIDAGPRTPSFTEVLELESVDSGLAASVLRVEVPNGAGAVIWLDGLDYIPESRAVQ